MKNILKNTRLYLKKVYKKFLLHHARYRIFVLLVCSFIAAKVSVGGSFWDSIFIFLLILAMILPLTLYFLDKQIRKDLRPLISPYLIGTPDKNKSEPAANDKFTEQDFFDIVAFIKKTLIQTYYILKEMVMNFLTRFPFFENYGLNKISHYRYNELRQLCIYLENKIKYIGVEGASIDTHYYNLSIRSNRSLVSNKFQNILKKEMHKYLNREVDGIFIRPKGHKAQLLIPIEYLSP